MEDVLANKKMREFTKCQLVQVSCYPLGFPWCVMYVRNFCEMPVSIIIFLLKCRSFSAQVQASRLAITVLLPWFWNGCLRCSSVQPRSPFP